MFQFYEGTTSENTSPRITVRKGGRSGDRLSRPRPGRVR